MSKLVLINEGASGVEIELKPGMTTIGRSENNSVAIDDEMVSECHCELMLTGQEVQVAICNPPMARSLTRNGLPLLYCARGRFCGLAMRCFVWKLKLSHRFRPARPHGHCFWRMFKNSLSRKNVYRC